MITVKTAINIVKDTISETSKQIVLNVEDSIGYILSEDVYSPINMPPFRQSAMDGYALNTYNETQYKLVGEVKAGDCHNPCLNKGEAVRIFTGAAVPDTANAVVMQEKVERIDGFILINSEIQNSENIRPLGEQIKKGELALKKNIKITASGIGFLQSLGITKIKVFQKPTIGIIVTGNELIEPGEKLSHGQIYESNGVMLKSALFSLGYTKINQYKTEDDYKKTLTKIENALQNNNLVLISGGISVGDYDFVGKALLELGVEQLFYKVKQKPGKPLFFGKTNKSVVFALPGNPASALSCFYNYVYIALNQLCGDTNTELHRLKAKSHTSYAKKGDRAQFLKAYYKNGFVEILEGQASSMLNTFAIANAFVFVPEDLFEIKKNDEVEVILIPQS
jgi:molybdopterin molybdotransferase